MLVSNSKYYHMGKFYFLEKQYKGGLKLVQMIMRDSTGKILYKAIYNKNGVIEKVTSEKFNEILRNGKLIK